MIKLVKKHWSKILLLQFIAIALICVFTSKTYAYTLNENGDLVSQNLANPSYFLEGNVINADGSTRQLNGYNCYYKLPLNPNTTYSISFSNSSIITRDIAYYDVNGSFISINNGMSIVGFTLPSNVYYISFDFRNDLTNIMINEGTTTLVYEPYGTWYNQQDYDQLQEIANGVQYGTLQYLDYMELYNSDTQEPIEKDGFVEFTLEYLKEHNVISNNGLFSVNYFINSTTNPNYQPYTIYMLFDTPVSINMFSMFFTSYVTGTLEVYGNNSTIINLENNSLIDYQDFNGSNVNYIEELYIKYGNADAISNISFNSFASQSYQQGFDYGQQSGEQKGYDRGYQQGNADGYQRGYNEGAEQDFESGGMKILFNSILSYPVNLIRSVFDFEFMGINVASLVMFIVSIGIVAFVISKFL